MDQLLLTALSVVVAVCSLGLAISALLRPSLERRRLRDVEVELVHLDQAITKLTELARTPQRREIMAKAREARADQLTAQQRLAEEAAAALAQQSGEVADARKPPVDKDALRAIASIPRRGAA